MDDQSNSSLSRPAIASIISNVQTGIISPPIQLIHSPNTSWPWTKGIPASKPIKIGILDSSFDPPTLAHLALAKSRPPTGEDYDARLLLLSVRNSDKTLAATDATYLQRLEMMTLLAKELADNAAVAVIDEPLFFVKGQLLSAFLRQRFSELSKDPADSSGGALFSLHFILGSDTLERVLSPKYYVPGDGYSPSSPETIQAMQSALRAFVSDTPDGTNCRITCARRDPSSYPALATDKTMPSPISYSEDLVASGKITMFGIGDVEQRLSSTRVRKMISSGDSNGWTPMVPKSVSEYIRREGLYLSY